MAHKLGIPFTADLVALGTNAAISNALIEKAVSAGKTEAQIDAAMSTLWWVSHSNYIYVKTADY